MIKKLAFLLFSSFFTVSLIAQTPTPPKGKVWVLNPEMSDEFDARSPDDRWKVYDKADSWDRTAAFDKRVQEVQLHTEDGKDNYILAMNPMWYEEEDIFTKNGRTYYFAGGGMATQASTTYGYMEVRIKASNFPMGSGVFMFSRQASDHPCGEKYSTELDIIENMSYNGPGYNENFNGKMNVNTHVWPTDENCNRIKSIQHGGDSKGLEGPLDFNVVGAHWKSKDSVDFYLNGAYWHSVEYQRAFDLEMPLILTMETYTWGSDENNAGNPKPEEYMWEDDFRTREERAVYYDWIRTWQLADIDSLEFNDTMDNVGFYENPMHFYEDSILDLTLLYSATEKRDIIVSIYDAENQVLGRDTFESDTGVKSLQARLECISMLQAGQSYQAICSLWPSGGDENPVLAQDTVDLIISEKPIDTKLFTDEFPTVVYPSSTAYTVGVKYQGAENMEIAVEVRDPSGAWIGGGLQEVPDGEGVVYIQANLIEATEVGSGYYWKSHIRPRGTTWRESVYGLQFVPFQVVEEPQNELSLASPGWPQMDTVLSVDVLLHYTALEASDMEVQLLKPDLSVLSDTSVAVPAGTDSLKLALALDAKPDAGKNYQMTAGLFRSGSDALLVTDTMKNLEFIEYTEPIGIQLDSKDQGRLRIYPNPASEKVFLELPEYYSKLGYLSLSDITGRTLLEFDLNKTQTFGRRIELDVSSLSSGYYFLRISIDGMDYASAFTIE